MPEMMEDDRGTFLAFVMAFQQLKRTIKGEEEHERYIQNRRRARRLKFYRQQRVQHVMFYLFLLSALRASLRCERSLWTKTRSSDWWEQIVLESFEEEDWQENFRMSHATFVYVCIELQCRLLRQNMTMRQAITVEKRVAVTLWKLATNSDYRSIGHLFGISKAAVCCIFQEVSQCIVDVLMP